MSSKKVDTFNPFATEDISQIFDFVEAQAQTNPDSKTRKRFQDIKQILGYEIAQPNQDTPVAVQSSILGTLKRALAKAVGPKSTYSTFIKELIEPEQTFEPLEVRAIQYVLSNILSPIVIRTWLEEAHTRTNAQDITVDDMMNKFLHIIFSENTISLFRAVHYFDASKGLERDIAIYKEIAENPDHPKMKTLSIRMLTMGYEQWKATSHSTITEWKNNPPYKLRDPIATLEPIEGERRKSNQSVAAVLEQSQLVNAGYEDVPLIIEEIKGFVARSSNPALAQELFDPVIEYWTVQQQALGNKAVSSDEVGRRMLESHKLLFERFPTAFQALPIDGQAYLTKMWIPRTLVLDEEQRETFSLPPYQNDLIRTRWVHAFNRIHEITNKNSLYQTVELCGLSEQFTRSMEIAGVNKSQRLSYQNWRDRYTAAQAKLGPAQSDLPAPPTTTDVVLGQKLTLDETLKFYAQRQSQATDKGVRRLYELLIQLNDPQGLPSPQTPIRTRDFIRLVAHHYKSFDRIDSEHISIQLSVYMQDMDENSILPSVRMGLDDKMAPNVPNGLRAQLNPGSGFKNLIKSVSKIITPIDLFIAAHQYGLGQQCAQVMAGHFYPPPMRVAYKNWERRNEAFIAECAARNQPTNNPTTALEAEAAKAVGDLLDRGRLTLSTSMKDLTGLVGPGSTIGKTFPVIASEPLQAEIDKQRVHTPADDATKPELIIPYETAEEIESDKILDTVFGGLLDRWAQRREAAQDPAIKKLYDLMIGMDQSSTSTLLEGQEKADFSKTNSGFLVAHAVATYGKMSPEDHREIANVFFKLFDGLCQSGMEFKPAFYAVCTPTILFQAVHLFDIEAPFKNMISKGYIPKPIQHAYKEWSKNGKNKTFISICKQRNAKILRIEDEPTAGASMPSEDPAGLEIVKTLQANLGAVAVIDSVNESFAALQRRFVANIYNPREAGFQELESRGRTEAETGPRQGLYQLMFDFGMQRESETFNQYKERTLKARRGFIPYILKHSQDFTMVERWAIDICLSHYYETLENTGAVARKEIKDSLADVIPDQLFRTMHTYGDVNEFQKSINAHLIPDRFRNLYPKWVRQNADFIAAAERDRSHQKDFVELVRFASDPDNADRQVMGGILLHQLQWQFSKGPKNSAFDMTDEVVNSSQWQSLGGADPQQMGQSFMCLIAQNWSILEELSPYLKASAALLPLISSYGGEETEYSLIHTAPLPELFAYVRLTESEDVFKSLLSPDGKFPRVTYAMYEAWKADPVAFEQGLAAQDVLPADDLVEPVSVILEEREMQSAAVTDPLLADPRVTYIDVHHPLVTSGNQTQSMGYSPVDEDRNLETGLNQGDDFQDRTRTLLKVLIGDAQSGVKKINVRWDRRNANDDNIEGRPYNLVDIEMQNGSKSRVAVCDYNGHMTYVERDAAEMQDQETLQISALRANRKVWTAVHVNDKQWCERIQEVLYTSLESLTPELKSRSRWHGFKGVLTETFAATVMATGNLPSPTDDRVIEHGPLAGRTTYSRMYNAANRGAVAGLDKGTTFNKLFAQLSSGSMPELPKFLEHGPLQAVDILAAWEDVKETFDYQATINEHAALIEVNHRSDRAIDLAFQFGAVQGLDKIKGLEQVMADKTQRPKSLKAFLRLVERKDAPIALAA